MEPTRNRSSQSRYSESPSEEEEINIYLKVTKTVAFNVKRTETIKNLKEMFREKEGYSENCQQLFFSGDRLNDDLKLVDCGINKNSTLHLFVQNLPGMNVFIKIPSKQKTIMLGVKIYETLQNMKTMIQTKEGIQADQFSLFYAGSGRQLKGDRTLASLNIKRGSTLHLVLNPCDVLSICLKMKNGNIKRIEVRALYTVGDIKEIVGSMIGVAAHDLRSTYRGKELEDDSKTLAFYDIKDESILEILLSSFPIFVKTTCGNITINVERGNTVQHLKERVFQKSELPVDIQRIFYAGRLLEEGKDLASYGIQKDSTLQVRLSLSRWVDTIEMPLLFPGNLPTTTMTICMLKAKIQKRMSYPVKEVYFDGKKSQDEYPLKHYGIDKDSKVTVSFNQGMGKSSRSSSCCFRTA